MAWSRAIAHVSAAAALFAVTGEAAGESVSARQSRTFTIVIDKMAFGSASPDLRVGDAVVWINRDLFRHTATASDKSFDVDLEPGKSARITLTRAGVIAFVCRYHPGMKGKLQVHERL